MGRKRIHQLLDQIQTNRQADIQNAAGIFAVAQVAINKLDEQIASAPSSSTLALPAVLPHVLPSIDRAMLLQQYGSYQACRKAAKQKGITLKNPTWEKLIVAFQYWEVLQNLVDAYLDEHPEPLLKGASIRFQIK